jgi:hypothetical protein
MTPEPTDSDSHGPQALRHDPGASHRRHPQSAAALLLLFAVTTAFCPARSTAGEPRTEPSLLVSVNRDSVDVKLILPTAVNGNDADGRPAPKAAGPAVTQVLRSADGYFEFPLRAGCHIDASTVRTDADKGLAIAEYSFCCDGVAAGIASDVSRVRFTGFDALGIQGLAAEAKSASRIRSKRLTADDNELRFRNGPGEP